jgi:GxxExxY protein
MEINEITKKIIKAAITVHRELGPGLLESVYHRCLCIELERMGVAFESEAPVPVVYRGEEVSDAGFRADLIVENAVVVELKSTASVTDLYKKQLLTYLKLTSKTVGLLINFNVTKLVDGLVRVANQYVD